MLYEMLIRRSGDCDCVIDQDDDGRWYLIVPCWRLVLAGMKSRNEAEKVWGAFFTTSSIRPSLWGEFRLLLRELFR